jgi:hypothetical protein
MSASYSGKARILDRNGSLLDVGKADLVVTDPEAGIWSGTLRVFTGSCLQSKSLTALVELEDGSEALAQVGPVTGTAGKDLILVKVVGVDRAPF